jgi:hypothetical protein
MATYNKIQQFVEDIHHKVHDLSSDQLMVALTLEANAPVATDSVLADLTEIADYSNCSTRNITTNASGQTSGTYELNMTDLTLTASGGTVGPFRYVAVYNDTPSSPVDPLIMWVDYGSEITLADGESLLIDFSDANGLFQTT